MIKQKRALKGHSRELQEYAKMRQAALKRAIKARTSAESALEQAISTASGGRAMLAERRRLADSLAQAFKRLAEGKVSRRQIENEHGKSIREFEKKYRPLAEEAWLKVAAAAPSVYDIYRALFPERKVPVALDVSIHHYLGWTLRETAYPVHRSPDDIGSSGQALNTPLDRCATSFDLKIELQSADVISSSISGTVPAAGSVSVMPMAMAVHAIPGAASGRAMVGTDFTFPPGFTQFSISADIDWRYDLLAFAAFGGAGSGADLVLRLEPTGGVNPIEKVQSLVTVVAPVLWEAENTGMGSSTLTLSQVLSDPASLEMKVFAGVQAHSEVEAVVGDADAFVTGTVNRICIHAE